VFHVTSKDTKKCYRCSSLQLTACLRDLARHFKTEHTETVALCLSMFGFAMTHQVTKTRCQLQGLIWGVIWGVIWGLIWGLIWGGGD
jgi:hypothetical protein